jgi:hypothetical protein
MNEFGRHAASPAELQEQLIAARGESLFLLYRDGERQQRIVSLAGRRVLTVARDEGADVALSWDSQVARLHAELGDGRPDARLDPPAQRRHCRSTGSAVAVGLPGHHGATRGALPRAGPHAHQR